MAGVDDVVGVGIDGVAAGTGASAAFTIARPRRRSHQTPVMKNQGLTTVAMHSSSSWHFFS